MKNKKLTIVALVILVVALLTGVFFVVFNSIADAWDASSAEEEDVIDVTSFSAYTKRKEFAEVPALIAENGKIHDAVDYGGNSYVIDVSGTTVDEYNDYLKLLEKSGFKKHSDNGKDGLEGYVKTAAFYKDDLAVTVNHVVRENKTSISANLKYGLSDHMIYKDEYVANIKTGAKTKMYLYELRHGGNCYVIQLKNGNFLIHDSGNKEDGRYLLDFLESLTPEGQKPVVEGWFVSHAHSDHTGGIQELAMNPSLSKRIAVNGFYYAAPAMSMVDTSGEGYDQVTTSLMSFKSFKDENGKQTQTYRPQLGQRYYFCDTITDVCYTVEQMGNEFYQPDFNDTCSWFTTYIEGQKFICGGDGAYTQTRALMNMYDKSYFECDFFSVLHHGINVYDYFTDFVEAKTGLYTTWREVNPYWEHTDYLVSRREETKRLVESMDEMYHYGNGTVEFTFPYTVGTAVTWEPNEWIYDAGVIDRKPAD